MSNQFFQFKQFTIWQNKCAMKVTTDGCLFGAWAAEALSFENMAKDAERQMLDIGTGTGLLSLMMAQKNNLQIDAIEIDGQAAQQAAENMAASPWQEKTRVIHADLLQWHTRQLYDVIIANPPFYEDDLKANQPEKNIAHHSDGIKLHQLLHFIKNHLAKDGALFLMLPYKRLDHLQKLLSDNSLFIAQSCLIRQSPNHQPFRIFIQAGCQPIQNLVSEEIVIRDHHQQYTPTFTTLLQPYYLHL